jgi:hypothetical protein
MNNDPVNQDLLRLGIFPAKPLRKIRGVTLTDEQYDEFQRIAGRLAKHTLDQLVNQQYWPEMPDYARKEIIENAIKTTRAAATSYMLMAHPDLLKSAVDTRVQEITGQKHGK